MEVPEAERNATQKAISSTFKSTAQLANLLPTGCVLVFQVLSPIFTNHGICDSATRSMTYALVILCGASCFVLTFSDTVKDTEGNISHGLATFNGLWVLDGSTKLPPEVASKYRIQFIDFMHAMMSILVFLAITMFDNNVVHCFCPEPSKEMHEVLTMLPLAIGVSCSLLFVAFPTQRHGIGFPLTSYK
ncbi:unnamed protein product [Trifolium pratense]|uniref:Uncharacterized protein n=1 Tax=Trifolium pratense TaxID=57577 RepID=A0ACB0KP23_TRIPR|nr:unnamed protein product [Trifolium pratense]